VGWNIVKGISLYHDVTVIYAESNHFNTSNYSRSVRDFIDRNPDLSFKAIPVPQPLISRLIAWFNKLVSFSKSGIGLAPLYFIAYRQWQKKAYREAEHLLANEKFDIVHQLTAISFRAPGYLHRSNLPLVWGPSSGMVKIPSAFYSILPFKYILYEQFRRLSNYIQGYLSVNVARMAQRASVIYAVTEDDYYFFSKVSAGKVYQMLDVGTYTNNFSFDFRKQNEKLQILWVGRIVYSKAINLLIDAILINPAKFKVVEFIIVGDGPLLEKYMQLSQQYHLDMIRWKGNLPHSEVLELFKRSDLLVHTSIKEATSAVVMEALTYGLPVICHDAFGMGIAINDTCGIKVPLKTPQISREGFYNALVSFIDNPDMLNRLRKGAIIRAKEISWEANAKRIANDYCSIVEGKLK